MQSLKRGTMIRASRRKWNEHVIGMTVTRLAKIARNGKPYGTRSPGRLAQKMERQKPTIPRTTITRTVAEKSPDIIKNLSFPCIMQKLF